MLTLLTAPNYSQQLSIIFAVCGESGGALLTTTHMLTLPSQAAKFQHGVEIGPRSAADSARVVHEAVVQHAGVRSGLGQQARATNSKELCSFWRLTRGR